MKIQQSLAGVIRERLAAIEARLEVGIRQEAIVEELAKEGYKTTLTNFRNELYRARKRKEKKPTGTVEATQKRPEAVTSRPVKTPEKTKTKPPGYDHSAATSATEDDLI